MELLIVGTGYVGLVTGACFAEMGHQVTCLDIDRDKVAWLQRGRMPFHEPGLEEIVHRGLTEKRLHFTSDFAEARGRVCFICVPTPALEDGSADVSRVLSACREVAEQGAQLIVIKSTVPVGTARQISAAIGVQLVSNPEFLKEGDAVNDCMKPDRIIVGIDGPQLNLMRNLYQPFMMNSDRMVVMDTLSAELTKYASNAMLACRISFMNELATLCEVTGASVTAVRKGMGSDPRIGSQFLYAGVGYGGSCFPKDVQALISMGRTADVQLSIVEAVHAANERQKRRMGERILSYLGDARGKTVAIWGLSFKPNTDDLREAPALVLIEQLRQAGVRVRLYDPVAMVAARKMLGSPDDIDWCRDALDAATGVDAVALITEWKQFRQIDLARLASTMHGSGFFDGRNQYDPAEMAGAGFDYFGVGTTSAAGILSSLE
jgi:UDPglucose 6-dehydrogenase